MSASIQHRQNCACAHVVHTQTFAEPVGEDGTKIGIAAPQPMHFQAVSTLLNNRHWRFRVYGFGFDYATVPYVACNVQGTVSVVRPFEALDFPFSQSCEAGHSKTSGCWFRKDGENRLDFFKGIGIGFGGCTRVRVDRSIPPQPEPTARPSPAPGLLALTSAKWPYFSLHDT